MNSELNSQTRNWILLTENVVSKRPHRRHDRLPAAEPQLQPPQRADGGSRPRLAQTCRGRRAEEGAAPAEEQVERSTQKPSHVIHNIWAGIPGDRIKAMIVFQEQNGAGNSKEKHTKA